MSNYVAFSYKNGNSFVHKMPVLVKILLIPALNILFFMLPFYFSAVLLVLQFVLACSIGFTLQEQFQDFKPVIYYAVLLYFTGFIAQFFAGLNASDAVNSSLDAVNLSNDLQTSPAAVNLTNNSLTATSAAVNLRSILLTSLRTTFTNASTAIMLLKLFCIMQSASIIFKTSTSLQIREGVASIEIAIRKILPVSKKPTCTTAVSLFVCFIPIVYKNWEQCKRAWFARGGKKSLKMYMTIFPVFFSVGIKQAWNSSRAILIRSENS